MSLKDFEIGKLLGKGAFGSVNLVKRKEDGITYAMKRVKIAQLSIKERENALNEIRILASLQHPNIIGYKEAFFDEESKTLNIVMEYADDGDIESKIKQNTRSRMAFQESTIWFWIIQILEGLKYLHDNKIMHRDLKCANIFLMKNGLLKLGDLNVSKIAKMGMAQTQTGTPYYASPEVWKDKPYDYKSDIWSVGCIIYEICTLHPPFRGTSLRNLYENINRGVYEPIPSMYSQDLKKIIAMMLVVEPYRRPSTDQLINCDIIQKKINSSKNGLVADIIEKTKSEHADLIKTIKLPRNMNDINKQLPKKRYKKKKEEEMMANDEYETKKADFFKKAMEEVKAQGANRPVSSLEQKPVLNNYNRDYKAPQEQKPTPYKYNYLNNYDNNMKKINREPPKEVPKNVNNYHYPQPSPSNVVVNNDDIKRERDIINDYFNKDKEKDVIAKPNVINYNNYNSPNNHYLDNKIHNNYNYNKYNPIDLNNKPYKIDNPYIQNIYKPQNPIVNKSPYIKESNKPNYYQYKPPSSNNEKKTPINSNKERYRNLYEDSHTPNKYKYEPPKKQVVPNRPISGNYKGPSRPISAKNPVGNKISNNNHHPSQAEIYQNVKNQFKPPVKYQNPYLRPAGKPSNIQPSNKYVQIPKRKVVYEKLNYQNYMARNGLEPRNNYHYKQNMINVGNKDNLYNAMGLKGNYGGAMRNGPKIVIHKK